MKPSEWLTVGVIDVDEVVPPIGWDLLYEEAVQLLLAKRMAIRSEDQGCVASRDGSFTSPARFGFHTGGSELRRIHLARVMVEHVKSALGNPRIVPYQCSYNFYVEGDFLGLHRDGFKATITFTAALTDNITPMGLYREMRSAPDTDLYRLVRQQGLFPADGEHMEVRYHGLRGFDGHNIPHWRQPHEGAVGILATLSYLAV